MTKEQRIERIRKLLAEYNEHKSLGNQEAAIKILKQMQMLQEGL